MFSKRLLHQLAHRTAKTEVDRILVFGGQLFEGRFYLRRTIQVNKIARNPFALACLSLCSQYTWIKLRPHCRFLRRLCGTFYFIIKLFRVIGGGSSLVHKIGLFGFFLSWIDTPTVAIMLLVLHWYSALWLATLTTKWPHSIRVCFELRWNFIIYVDLNFLSPYRCRYWLSF